MQGGFEGGKDEDRRCVGFDDEANHGRWHDDLEPPPDAPVRYAEGVRLRQLRPTTPKYGSNAKDGRWGMLRLGTPVHSVRICCWLASRRHRGTYSDMGCYGLSSMRAIEPDGERSQDGTRSHRPQPPDTSLTTRTAIVYLSRSTLTKFRGVLREHRDLEKHPRPRDQRLRGPEPRGSAFAACASLHARRIVHACRGDQGRS
jgi:hypothetical protein